jgi:phage tail sheath protein FI
MTDPLQVNVNLLALPGIREDYITNYTAKKVRDYGLSMYVMDLPNYDDNNDRIYDDSTNRINIENTASTFEGRTFDNNYVATYFPNVFINDATNSRYVKVPSSVAALGALGFNDKVAYPWFAPAGFNRAALDFVNNVEVRLNVSDRDRLYDARINPIATFPRLGFVIYGQKTLQIRKSALDRVNVRRLLLEVKRLIINIANRVVFEQNTPAVRNKFVADSILQLGLIQAQAGIEAYQVVMNETNNTQEDVDLNRLNGRIVVVPTRAIEFIAIDFIVTNSGVQFV